jgi:predicted nucleic acid-binding protein
VILCDTGPLVAIIVEDDPDHERCSQALDNISNETLLTSIPCLTEAMYLLHRADGHRAQELLWRMIEQNALVLELPGSEDWRRIRELMAKYADLPMDLADASLVAAAERLRLRRVFTLDRHFYAYRIHGKDSFDVVPAHLAH